MSDGLKNFLKIFVAIALIIISVWWSFEDIELDDLWDILANANYWYVVLSIPIIIAAHLLRAKRWKTMLTPLHDPGSVWSLFKPVMIGYAANNITPRGGELLRPFVYARQRNVSFSSTFATIVVERFIDLITLLLLFLFSLLIFQDKIINALEIVFSNMDVEIDATNFLFIAVLVIVVLLSSFLPPVVKFSLRVVIKPISVNLYKKLSSIFFKYSRGFAVIKSPKEYFRLAIESLSIWICYGLPNYIIFFCFDFQDTLNLTMGDAFLLLIVVGVAVTIAPTPGAIGVHHMGVKVALVSLYALDVKDALAYAIVTHAANYFINTLLGGIFWVQKRKYVPTSERIDDYREEMEHEIETDLK